MKWDSFQAMFLNYVMHKSLHFPMFSDVSTCIFRINGPLPVSQWRNDKPFGAAQEFILVGEAHICDVDNHLVWVLIEVETTLLQPLKITGAFDMKPTLQGENHESKGNGEEAQCKERRGRGKMMSEEQDINTI